MSTPRNYIGEKLRTLRREKGLTGATLARLVGYSQAGLSKIERGILRPSVDLVSRLCDALGVKNSDKDMLLEQTSLFLNEFNKWTVERIDSIPSSQQVCRRREKNAQRIRSYQNELIPGLLQTQEYMTHIFRSIGIADISAMEKSIRFRLDRQKVLKDRKKKFEFIIADRALGPMYVDNITARNQLSVLVNHNKRRNIEIFIAFSKTMFSRCPVNNFSIFDDHQVYIETLTHELIVWTEDDVNKYKDTFLKLKDESISLNDYLNARLREV